MREGLRHYRGRHPRVALVELTIGVDGMVLTDAGELTEEIIKHTGRANEGQIHAGQLASQDAFDYVVNVEGAYFGTEVSSDTTKVDHVSDARSADSIRVNGGLLAASGEEVGPARSTGNHQVNYSAVNDRASGNIEECLGCYVGIPST